MAHPNPPTRSLTLPTSHFLTHSTTINTPSLKIQVRPHLLVQASLIPPLATGRKVEEFVEVIVPVGGKVEVQVKVNTEALEDLESEAFRGMEKRANDHLISVLRTSHKELGLRDLEPVTIPPSSSSTTVRYFLNPITASPTHNVISRNLVPSGTPIAYLTHMQIDLSWVTPSSADCTYKQRRNSNAVENEAETVDEDEEFIPLDEPEGDIGSAEGIEESAQEDEEFFILDDSLEQVQSGRPSHGDTIESSKMIDDQVRRAIDRLLRTHFIRRFPLIFDGGFNEYGSCLATPRSLFSSLTHFLHLANTHNPSFSDNANMVMDSIAKTQHKNLRKMVKQAADLPARKGKRKKSKADSSQSQSSGSSPSKKAKRHASQHPSSQPIEEVESDSEPLDGAKRRANTYLREIEKAREAWEKKGARGAETRLHRIVGDAFGVIGRASFESRRKRGGGMSYNQIPLEHDRDAQRSAPVIPPVKTHTDPPLAQHCPIVQPSYLGVSPHRAHQSAPDPSPDSTSVETTLASIQLADTGHGYIDARTSALAQEIGRDGLELSLLSHNDLVGNDDQDEFLPLDDDDVVDQDDGGEEFDLLDDGDVGVGEIIEPDSSSSVAFGRGKGSAEGSEVYSSNTV
ncbi:hypothetical protein IAU59_007129 [Kwoniella sp. CBS 9459]